MTKYSVEIWSFPSKMARILLQPSKSHVARMNLLLRKAQKNLLRERESYPLPESPNQLRVIGFRLAKKRGWWHKTQAEVVYNELVDYPPNIGLAQIDPAAALWYIYGKTIHDSAGGDVIGVLSPPGSRYRNTEDAVLMVCEDIVARAQTRFF